MNHMTYMPEGHIHIELITVIILQRFPLGYTLIIIHLDNIILIAPRTGVHISNHLAWTILDPVPYLLWQCHQYLCHPDHLYWVLLTFIFFFFLENPTFYFGRRLCWDSITAVSTLWGHLVPIYWQRWLYTRVLSSCHLRLWGSTTSSPCSARRRWRGHHNHLVLSQANVHDRRYIKTRIPPWLLLQ